MLQRSIYLTDEIKAFQEQTVAFVPKLVAMVVALSITLPWIVQQLVDYSRDLIRSIPDTL